MRYVHYDHSKKGWDEEKIFAGDPVLMNRNRNKRFKLLGNV